MPKPFWARGRKRSVSERVKQEMPGVANGSVLLRDLCLKLEVIAVQKRKLLRKHDGRPVVAEEAVDRDDAAPPDGGEATSLKEAEEPGSRGGRGEAVAQVPFLCRC